MISDDTEHTLMVAQALLEHPDDAEAFQRTLAWKFRWWLMSLPAGVGFATLQAILKLWCGVSPCRSGVFSAGNGPAMRSAILGLFFANDPNKRRAFVRASTRLTHVDPKAETAAVAVAETAAWQTRHSKVEELLHVLDGLSNDRDWKHQMEQLHRAVAEQIPVPDFAHRLGLERGVTGYAFHTVPVAIYAALIHIDDFRTALSEVIRCGGDTDTVGAITGALVGANVGVAGIPLEWRSGLIDWPRSVSLLERVATRLDERLSASTALGKVRYFWPAIPLRNAFFLTVVLLHGFRRLFPPY